MHVGGGPAPFRPREIPPKPSTKNPAICDEGSDLSGMMEQLSLVGNALVAVAYVVSVALVVRTRQVRTDRVAAAAALFFAAGGAWYGVQVLLSWQAAVGAVSTIGLPAASPLWKGSLAVWDVFTAGVGVWYWTVRDRYPVFGLGARAQVVVGQPEAAAEHDTSTATLRHAEQARDEAMQSAVRARREALAQSQVNEQLMATMGYEIRTPMSGVIGLATLLLTTDLDPVQRRYAAGLHTAGNDLLGVLNAILDPSVPVSEPQAGAGGGGQRNQPDGRRRHAHRTGLPAGRGQRRDRSGRHGGSARVRRGAHGLPDAPDGRLRRDRRTAPARRNWPAHTDHRADRQRTRG
jgi:hypothetical protein